MAYSTATDPTNGLTFAYDKSEPELGGWYLTPCCGASGKGASVGTGVVCRGCYTEVDPIYGTGPAVRFGGVGVSSP